MHSLVIALPLVTNLQQSCGDKETIGCVDNSLVQVKCKNFPLFRCQVLKSGGKKERKKEEYLVTLINTNPTTYQLRN